MEQDLVVRETMALTPAEVVENATTQAKLLMSIVEQTKCYQNISGKKYLQVEAWETIGAFNRTHAETESVTPMIRDNETIGYQSHVQLWRDGIVVGGAIMPCYFTENCCKGKEGDAKHKSAMSAAQTFATSKAYRMNYSHVAILAGYQPLPFEEVTDDMRQPQPEAKTEKHWCKKHNVKFFKTPKMKAWAHPVKNEDGSPTLDDNGKQRWCSEKVEQPQAQIAVADPEEEPELSGGEPEPAVTPPQPPIEPPDKKPEHYERIFTEEEQRTALNEAAQSPAEESSIIDFDFVRLKETLKIVKWQEITAKSWLAHQFKVSDKGSLTDMIDSLSNVQLGKFVQHLEAMRESAGK